MLNANYFWINSNSTGSILLFTQTKVYAKAVSCSKIISSYSQKVAFFIQLLEI